MTSSQSENPAAKQAKELLRKEFGDIREEEITVVAAPGRVNLIGEHTDYNDGFVLPMALEMNTVIAAVRTSSKKCQVVSSTQPGQVLEFDGDTNLRPGEPSWGNYIKGVVAQYLPSVPNQVMGFKAAVVSNVPLGGGLSSSASLEVAVATLIESMFHIETSLIDKVKRCVECEHTFCNMPCGIMDQYISACGIRGNAVLIDCRDNSIKPVPLSTENVAVVIVNSNAKHQLSGSEYPDRVYQCEQAVKVLQSKFAQVVNLRDVSLGQLEAVEESMDSLFYKRARHVISENARTCEAVEALCKEDYSKFGKLMNESHTSLKNDYEVSTVELDTLVEIITSLDGVFGCRMTGAGFGGCVVALVKPDVVSKVTEVVEKEYRMRLSGKECTSFVSFASEGSRVIQSAS